MTEPEHVSEIMQRNLEDLRDFILARSVIDLELVVEELKEQQDGVTRHLLIQDMVIEDLRKVTSRLEAIGAAWAEQLSTICKRLNRG